MYEDAKQVNDMAVTLKFSWKFNWIVLRQNKDTDIVPYILSPNGVERLKGCNTYYSPHNKLHAAETKLQRSKTKQFRQ